MRVFISSVMRDFGDFRDTAAGAARTLDHQVLRAEDYGASVDTPQQACLRGVRDADVVLVILGARYGPKQQSGLSATHEEFREAQGSKHLLVFVQGGVDREPDQQAFVREVQSWESGKFTAPFTTVDQLRDAVTRALVTLERQLAGGRADPAEMLARAQRLVADRRQSSLFGSLCIVVSGGPHQVLLRPADLDQPATLAALKQLALAGEFAVLDDEQGTKARREGGMIGLVQETGSALLTEDGTLRVIVPARNQTNRPMGGYARVVIHEDVRERTERALRFAAAVLDRFDPTHRISDVVPLAALIDVGYSCWRTRAEEAASPNSHTMDMNVPETVVATLPTRAVRRIALTADAASIADDLVALLRRSWAR